jgi:hypothetical protein
MSDSEILTEVRIAVSRIEQQQVHIVELLQEHKTRLLKIEDEAGSLKGKVWLISTIVFGILASAWEVIKSRLTGHN